jgi:hypothetical protein
MHACAAAQVEGSGIAEPQRIVALFRSAAAIAGLSRFDEYVKLDTLVRRRRHRIAPHRTASHRSTVSGSGDGIVGTVNAARQNSALHVASYARLHVALFCTPLTCIRMCPFKAVDRVALLRATWCSACGGGPRGDQVTVVDGAKFLTDFRSVDTIAARPQLQAVPTVESPAAHAA